jgi:ribosomal protein L37E
VNNEKSVECPKCGKSNVYTPRSLNICSRCGFDLDRVRFKREADETPVVERAERHRFWNYITQVDPSDSPGTFYVRIIIFIVMVAWGAHFMKMGYGVDYRGIAEVNNSFMHLINLPVHEAGHVIFRPFGTFVMFLGGSLMQLLLPLGIMFYFVLRTRDNFGGAVALWWVAQSLKDLVPYINDARALKMMLLTGPAALVPETHDWRHILLAMGLLPYDTMIAAGANALSVLLFLVAFFWAGTLLMKHRSAQKAG